MTDNDKLERPYIDGLTISEVSLEYSGGGLSLMGIGVIKGITGEHRLNQFLLSSSSSSKSPSSSTNWRPKIIFNVNTNYLYW